MSAARRSLVAVSLWLLAFGGAASAASAAGVIWAHRGGPYSHGQPRYPENTMPAFRASAAAGYVLELDARITRDGKLVVMHDATLKRTTVCKGAVARRTAAYITHHCPSDVIGSPKNPLGWHRTAKTTRVPSLDTVLRFVRRARASVTIELKDRDRRAARALTLAIRRAHVPLRQVIVQSFRFTNLRRVRASLPHVTTCWLTWNAHVSTRVSDWISPRWPITAGYVRHEHENKMRVVTFTINSPGDMSSAWDAGVDALITDDPAMAAAH